MVAASLVWTGLRSPVDLEVIIRHGPSTRLSKLYQVSGRQSSRGYQDTQRGTVEQLTTATATLVRLKELVTANSSEIREWSGESRLEAQR